MMSHRLLNMSKSLPPKSDTTQPKNTMSDNKYKCFAIFGKKTFIPNVRETEIVEGNGQERSDILEAPPVGTARTYGPT